MGRQDKWGGKNINYTQWGENPLLGMKTLSSAQ